MRDFHGIVWVDACQVPCRVTRGTLSTRAGQPSFATLGLRR